MKLLQSTPKAFCQEDVLIHADVGAGGSHPNAERCRAQPYTPFFSSLYILAPCLVFLVRFVHSDWVVHVKSWDRVTHVHVDTDYTVLPSLYFEGLYHGKSHSP